MEIVTEMLRREITNIISGKGEDYDYDYDYDDYDYPGPIHTLGLHIGGQRYRAPSDLRFGQFIKN